MSIENEARKELERRRQEDSQRKVESEKRQQELEQARNTLSSRNQALIATLNLTPVLKEVRDKYWSVGKVEGFRREFNGSQVDFFGLKYLYEEVKMDHDPDSPRGYYISHTEITLGVGVMRISDSEVEIHFHYDGRELASGYQHRYEKLSGCKINHNTFEENRKIRDWVIQQITDSIIKMTGGDLERRDVYKDGLKRAYQIVEQFKKEKVERLNPEPDGCWKWLFN